MRKKYKYYIAVFTITAVLLTGCGTSQGTGNSTNTADSAVSTTDTEASSSGSSAVTTASTSQIVVDTEFTSNDLEVGYDESTATQITLNGSDISVSGDGAAAENGVLTISKEGTYVVTGTLNDGQILVDAADTDKIQIVLNGVTVTNQDNAAIYIKSADKVFITLPEGTVNTLTDGSAYVQTDDNNVDGVIYSKADLTINGSGTLNVTGNYKHGIASKDDLVITGGIINVTAVKDALNGKDAVKIKDGTITLSAETGNGIQSKNDEDATKGYVYIAGGEVTVTKSEEGIEGTVIQIDDGIVNITANDDGLNAASATSDTTNVGQDTGSADLQAASAATSEENSSTGNSSTANTTVTTSTTAASTAETVNLVSTDNTNVTLVSSTNSADTDSSATTPDSTDTNAPDNGNFGGHGNGGFGGGGFGGGGGGMENDADCLITINGGTITVNASGDGIDSNGSVSISGGTIYVSGPTDNGNAALDYNGTAVITGGTTVIVGSTGMAQSFSDTSTQYSLLYNLSSVSTAGTEVTLKDKEGNVIASYTPAKDYQSVVISSPELTKDATYTLTSGDQTADITLTSVVTSNGSTSGGFGGGRGFGGGQGGPGSRDGQKMMPDQDGTTQPDDANTTESSQSADSF